jgi:hypothetical protein
MMALRFTPHVPFARQQPGRETPTLTAGQLMSAVPGVFVKHPPTPMNMN